MYLLSRRKLCKALEVFRSAALRPNLSRISVRRSTLSSKVDAAIQALQLNISVAGGDGSSATISWISVAGGGGS